MTVLPPLYLLLLLSQSSLFLFWPVIGSCQSAHYNKELNWIVVDFVTHSGYLIGTWWKNHNRHQRRQCTDGISVPISTTFPKQPVPFLKPVPFSFRCLYINITTFGNCAMKMGFPNSSVWKTSNLSFKPCTLRFPCAVARCRNILLHLPSKFHVEWQRFSTL